MGGRLQLGAGGFRVPSPDQCPHRHCPAIAAPQSLPSHLPIGPRLAQTVVSHEWMEWAPVNWLYPGAYQRHIGRARCQQHDREREVHALAGDVRDGSHGRKHPAILGAESQGFFFPGFTTS